MDQDSKPYVHVGIDAVDAVAFDPEGRIDPDRFDRYPTFEAARNAALTCVEILLDLGDYDGEDHRLELEAMLELLGSAASFEDLQVRPDYRRFLGKLAAARPLAA